MKNEQLELHLTEGSDRFIKQPQVEKVKFW